MEYALLELEENLARIKAKASHIEMQRSKMEDMISFVRDQFIVLPEDIYKSMAMMKAQYAQFMAKESQLEAMLNFARQNYQSSLEKSDANMTSKSVNIPVGKQHEAMQHPKVPQCSEASSPPSNTPKPVQRDEKSDEEDEGMALNDNNGISQEIRGEKEHNVEIIKESPPIECENAKMVEEEVYSQAMIENLDSGEADFLGIEVL
ncbi:hypothetical protein CCACVL1_25229 [Corchorus capsularis]|uniref:Uncharacterized protein n=1 Tax=Corchorus capsularis TaxID=210143 RepID=A0A1R3GLI6_COCAP|nr:hypothetical protein CCACVL1_25229 [Corchorus capsularis]